MTLKPQLHGGNVWDKADESSIRKGRIIDFSSNISPLEPSRKVLNTIRNNFWKLHFYPQPDSRRLREVIAKHYGNLSYGNVIVGNGSCELIYLFTEVFVKDKTRALLSIPTFSEYETAIRRAGGAVSEVNPKKSFEANVETVSDLIQEHSLVVICNPNNPTGTLTDRQELLKIVDLAADHHALVFIDEAFMDFVEGQEEYSLARDVTNHPNLLVLRSLTKFYSLAGLRIGYGLASAKIIEMLHKAKIPWNVNTLAQTAAETALNDREYARRVRRLVTKERIFLTSQLRKYPNLRTYESEANFLMIDIRNTDFTGQQISELALKRGLMIRDCSSFKGLDQYHIRVAVKTRKQNLILLHFLENLSKMGRIKAR